MTDHHQTATERFLRHGVAGGFNGHTSYRDKMTSDDWEAQVGVIARELVKDIHALLLNPALWEAAGRSLGWNDIATNPENVSWLERQHRLIDHLAAHPGDVEGYLASLLDDDPLPHQEPCNCRDCGLLTDANTQSEV